jgi:hypothetical protein
MMTQTVVRAAPGLLASPVGDEVALLHLDSGRYYGLSPTAACLWPRLQQPARVAELLAWLLDNYAVDEAVARADLLDLLGNLLRAGLIEEVADAPPAPSG